MPPPLLRVVVGLVVIVRHRVDAHIGQQSRETLRDVGVFSEINLGTTLEVEPKQAAGERIGQPLAQRPPAEVIWRAAQDQLRPRKPTDVQAFRYPSRRAKHREHGLDRVPVDKPVQHAVAPLQERAPVVAHVVLHHPHVGQGAHAAGRGPQGARKHHHKLVLGKLAQQPTQAVGHLQRAPRLQVGGID